MYEKIELFEQMDSNNISVIYTGPFDGPVLSVIAKNIEYSLSTNMRVNKKVFKIFIELAQNISFYSAEQSKNKQGAESGVGILIIQELEEHFVFLTGNLAETKSIMKIIDRCIKINSLSRDKLRGYRRSQRKLPPGKKGGGNIGLIQVALTADSLINHKLIPVDENNSFFIVGVKIKKNP